MKIKTSKFPMMKNNKVSQVEAEFYLTQRSVDWMKPLKVYLAEDPKRHSTPHDLYCECARWFDTTGGKPFTSKNFDEVKHKVHLMAWIDYLKAKGAFDA